MTVQVNDRLPELHGQPRGRVDLAGEAIRLSAKLDGRVKLLVAGAVPRGEYRVGKWATSRGPSDWRVTKPPEARALVLY
jgi:hypothetical protein